jgi:restriction endonuclease Mrr
MLIKLKDGREKDVALTEVNKDNYIVPMGEEDTYHCKIEVVKFSTQDGRRLSRPRIQKFDKKIYEQIMQKQLPLQGYTVEVLYNPTDYLKKKEKEKAEAERKLRQAKQRSEENKKQEFEKAVQKAVAEEIARLSKNSKGKKDAN